MRNTKKLRQFGIFLLIILLSTYLPQTIRLYVTIILGLGADVYSLILTMGLVGSFLLLIWRLKKKKMLFIFEKKSWNWSFVFYLFATYVVYQILGNFWARYAHLINHRNIHDEYFTVVLSNGQPTFLSTILSFVLPVIIDPVFEETLDRGYFMNTFFPKSKYYLDVILSGLIFGLSHLILSHRDPISLLYYSLIGFFFALVYRSTDNLRLTILCHSFLTFSIMQNLSGFLFTIISIIIFLDSGRQRKKCLISIKHFFFLLLAL
ncbi:TPA: type II CAAX endopeptidase family protein [Streptococcus pneumoniae]|uniref:CPBP family intramembrane glutamic endopeptidase n=3 Tax=Streptococcus pneumoniae TaxID=1313 RepID=UPI0001E35983|nr:type II CAAX endopeptidase family protein [Streptococcus pneumoniae]EGI87335.1 CAAX amino terminal protease family protein [Streptococcus pneumoniae GA17545]EHD88909.1 CAAX amino terminal protease family protein [Streptococcus pneumoniae GA11304]EHE02948.1 CAAX amino terminal protease family protein [Streptococcus pneumoniae GA16242]EIA00884.1 CAAX amino terminal protease self- immunity family protein [Streptococcus pneumoniae GA05578]EJG95650.1 CAAX amino terminal protease family protein [